MGYRIDAFTFSLPHKDFRSADMVAKKIHEAADRVLSDGREATFSVTVKFKKPEKEVGKSRTSKTGK